MPVGLFALALGGFGIGLTEFVIMGLLPDIATDFAVSESTAGYLISGYAISVALGAVLVTAAVSRMDRKKVLMGLLVLFIAGNFISAIATSYSMLMIGRVVAALCHGAFFGIGAVVAASMVAPNRRAGAIATMFAGLTIANVLGVPFGTFLGQHYGWRSTFWAITAIGIVAIIGIATLVPKVDTGSAPRLRAELTAFKSLQVWLSIGVTILGFGGMFGAFTYISYTFTDVSGFSASTVPWLLVLFGGGLFVGNYVGGKVADRALEPGLAVILAILTVILAGFALTAHSQVATIVFVFAMGASGFAITSGVQMRIMNFASSAPTMASGANIAAFNIGNALGAWLGGATIDAGLGYTAPIWSGSAMALGALAVLLVAMATQRRTHTRVTTENESALVA